VIVSVGVDDGGIRVAVDDASVGNGELAAMDVGVDICVD
jgi:hypothetical protein